MTTHVVSVLMVTSTTPVPTYEQPCGSTKSVGVNDADATGEGDALGEADAEIGEADAGIGDGVAAEDAARDPQADTTSIDAIKSTAVGLMS